MARVMRSCPSIMSFYHDINMYMLSFYCLSQSAIPSTPTELAQRCRTLHLPISLVDIYKLTSLVPWLFNALSARIKAWNSAQRPMCVHGLKLSRSTYARQAKAEEQSTRGGLLRDEDAVQPFAGMNSIQRICVCCCN